MAFCRSSCHDWLTVAAGCLDVPYASLIGIRSGIVSMPCARGNERNGPGAHHDAPGEGPVSLRRAHRRDDGGCQCRRSQYWRFVVLRRWCTARNSGTLAPSRAGVARLLLRHSLGPPLRRCTHAPPIRPGDRRVISLLLQGYDLPPGRDELAVSGALRLHWSDSRDSVPEAAVSQTHVVDVRDATSEELRRALEPLVACGPHGANAISCSRSPGRSRTVVSGARARAIRARGDGERRRCAAANRD